MSLFIYEKISGPPHTAQDLLLCRNCTTPVIQTERMHDCLVTVQVWNKLVQRSECHLKRLFKTQCNDETDKEKLLKSALINSLSNIAELLNDGKHNIYNRSWVDGFQLSETSLHTSKREVIRLRTTDTKCVVTINLLLADDTLMDVRLTCGLSLPLLLKSLDHLETIPQVRHLCTLLLLECDKK